jgi:peptide/nickel transport system ATP-binding protein
MKTYLETHELVIHYRGAKEPTLKGVSLEIEQGQRFALVGESGSGKSTLAKALLGLAPITRGLVRRLGSVVMGGETRLTDPDYRRRIQMIFQDPYNSLHPRLSVMANLMEPLKIHGLYDPVESPLKGSELLERVGLDPAVGKRYPHEFSGGQLQRIGIARALLTEPHLLLADEPVSALDVSVQAQVLNLLGELSEERGLGMLLISHDLAVVRQICQRVAVMFQGRLVEVGSVEQICFSPRHPYTKTLVQATLGEEAPVADACDDGPGGCPFLSRCLNREDRCKQELPLLLENEPGRACACHFP